MSFKSIIEKIAPLAGGVANYSYSPQRVYAQSILSTWEATPSLGNLFFIVFNFNSVNALKYSLDLINILEDYNLLSWDIASSSFLLQPQFQSNTNRYLGCVFAREVSMPGEQVNSIVNVGYGGHPGRPVMGDRSVFGNLDITFLETNASFVDIVIRPWNVLVGYYGLISRGQQSIKNVKCSNVSIYELSKDGAGQSMVVRKQTNYFNVVPVSIDGSAATHADEGFSNRRVSFLYEGYSMSDGASFR